MTPMQELTELVMKHGLVEKAKEFATVSHQGQSRWGGEPYITHPESVADILNEQHGNAPCLPPFLVAAWLHDVIEDTDATPDDLRKLGFPEEIIEAVEILTHEEHMSYKEYINEICTNLIAIKVKIADITHNMSDLDKHKKKDKKDKYDLALDVLYNALGWLES
jgi:(p)ppGpp synthase/HD superfamily hydrolase